MDYKQFNDSLYINGDCLLLMQQMIDKGKKVNCIIVDPPYGINHKSNRRKDKNDMTTRSGILNDVDNEDLLEKAIELSYEILEDKSHIYWFTRWDMLDIHLPMLKKFYNLKNTIIWDKGNRGSGDLLGAYGGRYECIIYGMKGRRNLNKVDGVQRHDDIWHFSKVSHQKLIHPHQKPLDLLEFAIEKSTNKGDTILDMFSGVGSTLKAAINKNRKCIAIELDNEVYKRGITYINEDFVKSDEARMA